jgi:hypothetical protein
MENIIPETFLFLGRFLPHWFRGAIKKEGAVLYLLYLQ